MQPESSPIEKQSGIFDDLQNDEREVYDYGVRKIRNALFIAGGIMLAADVIAIIRYRDAMPEAQLWLGVGVAILIQAVFIGLGLWAKKKPYTALLAGLGVFAAIQVLAMIGDSSSIFHGLIVKAIVVISLAFWLKQAKRLQQMKRVLGH